MRYIVYFIMCAGLTYILVYNIAKPITSKNRMAFIATIAIFWFVFGFLFFKILLTGSL